MSNKLKPRELVKANVTLTVHPKGIEQNVRNKFEEAKKLEKFEGPKTALILGGSNGYGLATRIALAVGAGTDTISLSTPRFPSTKRPLGNSGFWGQNSFQKVANENNLPGKSIFMDAFSDESRAETIKIIKEYFGDKKLDLFVYSIASPKRQDPKTGILHVSSLKTLKGEYTGQSIDVAKKTLKDITVGQATQEEIDNTVKVMGGEDWELWVSAFVEAGVVSDNFKTIAYTYLGSPMTDPIYRHGSIGKAKEHLEATAKSMTSKFGFECSVVSAKAVITAASVFIPTFPVYASALYKTMKKKGTHEDTLLHMYRLYKDMVYGDKKELDDAGIYRPDYWELDKDVQAEVKSIMEQVTEDNFVDLVDAEVFIDEFHHNNGFRISGVDYDEEFDPSELIIDEFKPFITE